MVKSKPGNYTRFFKTYKMQKELKFNVGDVVRLKSDINGKCPMTINKCYPGENQYQVVYLNSQNTTEYRSFQQNMITLFDMK